MGFTIHGITSGLRNLADDAIDRGGQFAREISGAAKGKATQVSGFVAHAAGNVADKTLDVGVPLAGTVIEKGYQLLPGGTLERGLGAAERVIDAGASVVTHIPGVPGSVKTLASDISQINLQGATDDAGLEGDWGSLFNIWLFERRPASLGTWDTVSVDGQEYDRVHVTDMAYAQDLSKLDTQQSFTQFFLAQHPVEGQEMTVMWQYTGPGTQEGGEAFGFELEQDGEPIFIKDSNAPGGGYCLTHGGHYGTLESFIGSYETTIKVASIDPATGKVTLQYTVTNESHWESGTRVNASAQRAGLPPFLVPDQESGEGSHLGGNFQQVYSWEQTYDNQGNPVGGIRPVTTSPMDKNDTAVSGGGNPRKYGGDV